LNYGGFYKKESENRFQLYGNTVTVVDCFIMKNQQGLVCLRLNLPGVWLIEISELFPHSNHMRWEDRACLLVLIHTA